jgi:hypothetical protein
MKKDLEEAVKWSGNSVTAQDMLDMDEYEGDPARYFYNQASSS